MTASRQTDELIRQLARDASRVRLVPRLRVALAASAIAWAATAAFFAVALGPWHLALQVVSRNPVSALVLVGLLALGAGALLRALSAVIPGRESAAGAGLAIAVVSAAGILAAALTGHFAAPADWYSKGPPLRWDLLCAGYASCVGLPSVLVTAWLCLRAAPSRAAESLIIAGLGGAALGAALVQAVCGEGSARHTIGSHVVAPAIVLGSLGLGLYALTRAAERRKRDRPPS